MTTGRSTQATRLRGLIGCYQLIVAARFLNGGLE